MECSAHSQRKPSHVIAATLFSFWLTTHQTFPQVQDVAFGTVQAYPTPGKLEQFRLVNKLQSGEQRLLLWSPGSTTLFSVNVPFSDSTVKFRVQYSPVPFDDLLSADFNGDGVADLLLVQKEERRVLLVFDLAGDSLRIATTQQLPFEPTKVIAGDVNNDKRIDFLVADRKNTGVVPFLGLGKGTFRQEAIIVPENAVSDMTLFYLNNDFLSDLVFFDWVKSELHFSYGVGRGRFLDLTTMPVEGDVKALYATSLAFDRFMDIVLEQPTELQIWEGDVTGDFRKKVSLPVSEPITAFDVADINDDGRKDFAFLDRNGTLKVMLNPLEEGATAVLDFYAGHDAKQLLLADLNNDKNIDALVLRSDRLVFYDNAMHQQILVDSLQYAAGVEPRGVWIGDISRDRNNDVVTVNRGSNSLSIYNSKVSHGLFGQMVVPLPKGPRQLAYHSTTDSTVNFLVTYPATQSISFLSIHRDDLSTVNALIPDVGELELLLANTTRDGLAEFFCYNVASGAGSPSLVFYQQLEQKTFIERTFSLTIPNTLLGAAVGDVNNDRLVDIAFAYRNNDFNRNELVLSIGDSTLSYKNRYQVLPLPEGNLRKSYMWIQDFDRNDTLDLVLLFPQTLKQMMLAKGTTERKFQITGRMPDEISLTDRSQLQILDLDRDGVFDLAVNNTAKSTLGWYPGKSDGTFMDWKPLLHSAEVSHFAFGDLNGDGVSDLAVTLSAEGLLKLYDGRLFFKKAGGDVGR